MSRVLAVPAAAVWIAAALILLSADWFLKCTVDGQELGGIDCFQANAVPRTHTAPASWLGFAPLAIAWCAATLTLIAALVIYLRRR